MSISRHSHTNELLSQTLFSLDHSQMFGWSRDWRICIANSHANSNHLNLNRMHFTSWVFGDILFIWTAFGMNVWIILLITNHQGVCQRGDLKECIWRNKLYFWSVALRFKTACWIDKNCKNILCGWISRWTVNRTWKALYSLD